MCARARACVRVRVRACVCVCARACGLESLHGALGYHPTEMSQHRYLSVIALEHFGKWVRTNFSHPSENC